MSYIPYVIEKTSGGGERAMDIFSRLLMDRIIFVGYPIDDQSANLVIAMLIFLRAEDPKKAISLYINSPGGNIQAGMAIYDTLLFLGCEVHTYCIGQCVGVAALLLAAGAKGKRFALPHSRIVLNQPIAAVGGQASDIQIHAQAYVKVKNDFLQALSTHTGKPHAELRSETERDRFMNPEEATAWHIIDKVIVSATATGAL